MNARNRFLQEMGYTLWRTRAPNPPASASASSNPLQEEEAQRSMVLPVAQCGVEETRPAIAPSPQTEALSPMMARQFEIARMDWDGLTAATQECRACGLCRQRKQAVLGVGDRSAEWLFIGEAPGAEEDVRGEPFVGQAGKLLDAMLAAIGLKRGNNVYIANTVKCRPEGNRTPHHEEMSTCHPFLKRQIALLQPRLIVLLGKAAVHGVLGEDRSLAAMRKKRFQYETIPVVVTYHPAYLLRNLPEKAKAWEDLCFARQFFAELGTEILPVRD